MTSETRTRTVRFSETEANDIESFLQKNPFLDFSTLARLAIAAFIHKPTIKVNPVKRKIGKGVIGDAR